MLAILSFGVTTRAGQKAKEADVRVNCLQLNACSLPFKSEFDFAIMLCEGGFSLQETDALNFQILEGTERALRSPGKLIFSTLNASCDIVQAGAANRGTPLNQGRRPARVRSPTIRNNSQAAVDLRCSDGTLSSQGVSQHRRNRPLCARESGWGGIGQEPRQDESDFFPSDASSS